MSYDRNEKQCCCNYWLKLPRDITIMILQKLGILHILLLAQLVCTEWRNIVCTDPSMWSTIRVVNWKSYWDGDQLKLDEYREHVENMIRRAVDLSRGSLFDLDLDEFMSEQLLCYVVERCTQIKRLWGKPCRFTGDDVVEKVAARLPLLEDLELVGVYGGLSLEAIENLGRYCPRLRSLKIHGNKKGDEEAKAIARSMPQLRHICFASENRLTDVGFRALLDGCPHLESLILDIQKPQIMYALRGTFQMMKKLPLTRTQRRDKLDNPCTWSTIRLECSNWFHESYVRKFKHVIDVIRCAVDKSGGGLVDVDLDIFTCGDILSYIVERCTRIRRLRIIDVTISCKRKEICAAATRLPLLENLELVYLGGDRTEIIETLGRCCPKLTSLEIHIHGDNEAKTIARSLPQLRHLKPYNYYSYYGLTDVGVKTLLDGCLQLESLDLQSCSGVRLHGTLWFRCFQQINHMAGVGGT